MSNIYNEHTIKISNLFIIDTILNEISIYLSAGQILPGQFLGTNSPGGNGLGENYRE